MNIQRLLVTVVAALTLVGCSVESNTETGGGTGGGLAPGASAGSEVKRITANGSSTVGPITSLVGEFFEESHPDIQVPVTITGTGTGFGVFAAGESDISNASRRIKDSETEKCAAAGIEYLELTVAMDGISVVVNKENDFVDALTTAQLKQIWAPGSSVKTWKDVNPEWPDEAIKLYGPGRESGTFDYFTEKINGDEGATRDDYSPSGDDNLLVTGVAGDKYSLGYFGYGYYEKNKDKLKLLGISSTEKTADAVLPSPETIQSGTYVPLSRPVFIYVNKASLKRPEVAEFVSYYLNDGQKAIPEVGCVHVAADVLEASRQALAEAVK